MKKLALLPTVFLMACALLCVRVDEPHIPAHNPGHVPLESRYIALTFDDGPHPEYTERIVDTLASHGARGTFFVLGSRIQNHLPQLRQIAQSGSMIANHTWDHLDLTTLASERLEKQIGSVYGSIRNLCGTDPWLVRPPYGFANEQVRQGCAYPIICWSIDTLDWAWLDGKRIAEHVLAHASDGDIILMHDIYPSTAEAVELMVPALQARGFELVTVPELFKLHGIPLESGHVYYHAK